MDREPPDELLDADSVVDVPLSDVLDLHGFRPRDVRDVVRAYLDEACAAGFRSVRLIHGRGIGVQRESVRKLLAADPRVLRFGDAPGDAGGWGATVVELRPSGADD